MDIIRAKDCTADRPRGAIAIANMNGITTRLHWTDQLYQWHINDGEEVFVVLDSEMNMHYKQAGAVRIVRLKPGDIAYAAVGTEHVAHPIEEARILVVEKVGSV